MRKSLKKRNQQSSAPDYRDNRTRATFTTAFEGVGLRTATTAAALVLSIVSLVVTATGRRATRREIEDKASLHTVRQIRADLDAVRAQVEFEAAKRAAIDS